MSRAPDANAPAACRSGYGVAATNRALHASVVIRHHVQRAHVRIARSRFCSFGTISRMFLVMRARMSGTCHTSVFQNGLAGDVMCDITSPVVVVGHGVRWGAPMFGLFISP